jgi:hypothetical protein
MWRALLTSGVLLAPLRAKIEASLRYAAVMAVAVAICLLFVTVGLFALAVAAIIALTPEFGLAAAAAIVGGAAILVGLIILLIGTLAGRTDRKPARRPPSIENAAEKIEQSVKSAPTAWLLGATLIGLILGRRV